MGVPVQGHIGTPEFSGCRKVWDGGVVTKLWLSNGTNVLMVMRNKLRITEATTFTPIYKIRKYLWPLHSELLDVGYFGSPSTFQT